MKFKKGIKLICRKLIDILIFIDNGNFMETANKSIYYDVFTIDDLKSILRECLQTDTIGQKIIESLKRKASAGDKDSKLTLVNKFVKYISTTIVFSNEEILDSLIKTYKLSNNSEKSITYFDEIYEGDDKDFDEILNEPCITRNSSHEDKVKLLAQIAYQEMFGFSIIDPYAYNDLEKLNEICINNYDFIVFQINGKKRRIKNLAFKDDKKYYDILLQSVSNKSETTINVKTNNQKLSEKNPESLTTNLSGVRVSADISPYSFYPSLNLRFTNSKFINKSILIKLGTSTIPIEDFIDIIMPGRPNIFVLGGQGCGKTNYIRRLIGSIPDHLSILTIESQYELNIPKYFPGKDVKMLRFSDIKTPEDCFATGLRLNRDIIVDGEVRIPQEAYITLEAMTRQNRGSMGSFHTSSNEDFIYDYKNLLMKGSIYKNEESAFYDIARAVNLLIYISMNQRTGKRTIHEISELKLDRDNYHKPFQVYPLFKYNSATRKMETKHRISNEFIERAYEYEFSDEDYGKLQNLYKKLEI